MPRRILTPEERQQITLICSQPSPKEFDGKPCPYCGITMIYWRHKTRVAVPANAATRDHVRPRSKRGILIPGNRLVVCWKCNVDKADLTLAEWISVLRRDHDDRLALVMSVAEKTGRVD